MNIKRIEIDGLYGYMNKSVDFNKSINLLVGINGSGKTSVLNIINWLLVPSFPNLCSVEFKSILLTFDFNEKEYEITCKQHEKEITIDVFNATDSIEFQQIQADFKIHPKNFTRNSNLKKNFATQYYNLSPEEHEIETWNFLSNQIPNPTVIGLDRTLYAEEGNSVAILEDERIVRRKAQTSGDEISESPLDKVSKMAREEYLTYRNKILDLNSQLNDKLLLSSFDEPMTDEMLKVMLSSERLTIEQVINLEKKVKDYFIENMFEKSRSQSRSRNNRNNQRLEKIENYFKNLKFILKKTSNTDIDGMSILYITNVNQFKKLRDLIREFEEFESSSKRYYRQLHSYLESINRFLRDSSKELYFDKRRSRLMFRVLNKGGEIIQSNRSLKDLSSGEKQILILFTYIKFNDKNGKLFIIDEPELSLHPKWQEQFLEGIKSIMTGSTQLMFATHSPAIVGNNSKFCKVLLPYNE